MKKKLTILLLLTAVMLLICSAACAMQIYVKPLKGETLTLDVEPTDDIDAVKTKIQEMNDTPVGSIRLLFNGEELEDNATLEDYSIPENSTLKMVPRNTIMPKDGVYVTGGSYTAEWYEGEDITGVCIAALDKKGKIIPKADSPYYVELGGDAVSYDILLPQGMDHCSFKLQYWYGEGENDYRLSDPFTVYEIPVIQIVMKSGDGTGDDIVFSNTEAGRIAASRESMLPGQFWAKLEEPMTNSGDESGQGEDGDEDDVVMALFCLPASPESFSAPAGKSFKGWLPFTMEYYQTFTSSDPNDFIMKTGYELSISAAWTTLPLTAHWAAMGDTALFNLLVPGATMEPEFTSDYTNYNVYLPYDHDQKEYKAVAVPYDSNAAVTYNGFSECPVLTYGLFPVKVTNGDASRTYYLYIQPIYSITVRTEGQGTVRVIEEVLSSGMFGQIYDVENNTVKAGQTRKLVAVPAEDWLFKEWRLVSGDGTIEDTSSATTKYTVQNDNAVITAVFEAIPPAVLTLDPQGGTVSPTTVTVGADHKPASLPDPVREGWKFGGWYTEAELGREVTTDSVFREDTTIYAHWYQDSPYELDLPESISIEPGEHFTPLRVDCTRLELNPLPDGRTPVGVRLVLEGGTLTNQKDSSVTIPYQLSHYNSEQYKILGPQKVYTWRAPNEPYTYYIYIGGDTWDTAAPGTYTGVVSYYVIWQFENSISGRIREGSIPVTLKIPGTPETITSDGYAAAWAEVSWLEMAQVTEATEGTPLIIEVPEDALTPEDQNVYCTGEMLVDGVSLGGTETEFGTSWNHDYVMPDHPISIAAVTAPRIPAAISLNRRTSVNEDLLIQLWMHVEDDDRLNMDDDGHLFVDVNGDGMADLQCGFAEESGLPEIRRISRLEGTCVWPVRDAKAMYGPLTFKLLPVFDITLPDDTTAIEAGAFENDTKITSVDAGSCKSIGAGAFSGCTGLTKIRLPQNCTIGTDAFSGCTSLTEIYGPAGGTTEAWAAEHQIRFVEE